MRNLILGIRDRGITRTGQPRLWKWRSRERMATRLEDHGFETPSRTMGFAVPFMDAAGDD
jgi:hypothetical protein